MDNNETIDYLVKNDEPSRGLYFTTFFHEIMKGFVFVAAVQVVFKVISFLIGYGKVVSPAPMDDGWLVASTLFVISFIIIVRAHIEAKSEVFFIRELCEELSTWNEDS